MGGPPTPRSQDVSFVESAVSRRQDGSQPLM